jgi:Family of unknown function (DUF6526)
MSEQNYKNHSRLVPVFHYLGYLVLLGIVVLSIMNLVTCMNEYCAAGGCLYPPILFLLIAVLLVILMWYTRFFALRAQDRAIRAEENLRHFIATGKPHDRRLRMSQIIALRFAGDDEFVALSKKAAEENMSAKEIKMAVQHWKADHNRV